jgi:hypothetical protein
MAEYDFECRNCKKTFTLFMRVTERMKSDRPVPGLRKRGRGAAHASVLREDREEELIT